MKTNHFESGMPRETAKPAALRNERSFLPLRFSPVAASLRLACGLLFLAAAAYGKLNVVATTADLAAIAKAVGGDQIDVTTLARPTEDPHFVDAKPSFVVKLNRADVLIEGGAELEIGWLPPLLAQARNDKLAAGAPGRIDGAKGIAMLDVPATLDRSRGDIHAVGNPHYVIAPSNAKMVAQNIAAGLAAVDAGNAERYRTNLQTFTAALDAKLAGWRQTLAPFRGRSVVAYHDSWPYFAREFGLKMDLFLEPKPGIPPTPAHLAEVIKQMKAEAARVIFVDAYLNRKTAETVARSTGAAVLDVTQFPGGVKGTEGGYLALVDYLVNSLAKELAGENK
jgi:zinc/manganese transport system substrate-binding protein